MSGSSIRAFVHAIEGGVASLRLGEDETVPLTLPLAVLPKGVKEGDVLRLSFTRDPEGQKQDAAANDARRRALLERGKDVEL